MGGSVKFLAVSTLFYSSLLFAVDDPLRNTFVAESLENIDSESKIQSSESEYWIYKRDELSAYNSESLGNFLKIKFPLAQTGVFESSYVNDTSNISTYGFEAKSAALGLG